MDSHNTTFDFNNMSHEETLSILKQHNIILTINEALTIQNELLQRPPSLAECVLWSIQCSEHCSYKTSRSHLKKLITDGPNVILGAKEDAGIVCIAKDDHGRRYGVAISHESHNHPSQIVPFEGAATGVGGNVRDVCCMGAEVIAIADSLRFGSINNHKTLWIHEGVISGIASYGNALGIPNIGGDVYYDAAYNDNCLVTVVSLGIVREDKIIHSYVPQHDENYDLILVGKATDNSGFAGASFASIDLKEEEKEQNRGAVQEPNAFLERHLLKATYELFKLLKEKNLLSKVAFKDLGAGGIACASVELAESGGYGAEIDLDKIPVSVNNLPPSVILCSETQERFMWAVPTDITPIILNHYNKTFELPSISELAQATVIGKIKNDKNYIVRYQGAEIVNAKAADITKGIIYNRPTKPTSKKLTEPKLPVPQNFSETFFKLLSHENIASRIPIFETYDKQVQGRSIIEAGVADAGVLQPFNSDEYPIEIRKTGIALSTDHNPRYCKIDPYWGTINAVIEAARNIVAVGATPQAITDCLCFGNPEIPEQMHEFTMSIKGLNDACHALPLKNHPDHPLPVVAGNVSFYNESKNGAIPASPMISCLGILTNINKTLTLHFKQTDSLVIMIGERKNECGGSAYYSLFNELGANLPKPNLKTIAAEINVIIDAINDNLLLAAHDISDGGIAIALAKMSFENEIGVNVNIKGSLPNNIKLFSETGGFALEITKEKLTLFEKLCKRYKIPLEIIGQTTNDKRIKLQSCIDISIDKAKECWHNGLREKLL